MILLKPLHPEDFDALCPVVMAEEWFKGEVTEEQVKGELANRAGWTVWDSERLIGAITLTGIIPNLSAIIHAVIDAEYHGRWATRQVLRHIFGFLFVDLKLRRISGYSIPWKTFDAGNMLTKLGFRVEGIIECGGMNSKGEYYDVVLYGMLAERCPWLWDKKKLLSWMKWRKESGFI